MCVKINKWFEGGEGEMLNMSIKFKRMQNNALMHNTQIKYLCLVKNNYNNKILTEIKGCIKINQVNCSVIQ